MEASRRLSIERSAAQNGCFYLSIKGFTISFIRPKARFYHQGPLAFALW
jgi:hypothetical protein